MFKIELMKGNLIAGIVSGAIVTITFNLIGYIANAVKYARYKAITLLNLKQNLNNIYAYDDMSFIIFLICNNGENDIDRIINVISQCINRLYDHLSEHELAILENVDITMKRVSGLLATIKESNYRKKLCVIEDMYNIYLKTLNGEIEKEIYDDYNLREYPENYIAKKHHIKDSSEKQALCALRHIIILSLDFVNIVNDFNKTFHYVKCYVKKSKWII